MNLRHHAWWTSLLLLSLAGHTFGASPNPPAAPATQAEVNAGLNRSKFVSPATLSNRLSNLPTVSAITNNETRPVTLASNLLVQGTLSGNAVLTNATLKATTTLKNAAETGIITMVPSFNGNSRLTINAVPVTADIIIEDGWITADRFVGVGTPAFGGNGGGLSNTVDIIAGNNVTVVTNAHNRSFTISTTATNNLDWDAVVIKSAAQSVTNNATPQDDTELVVALTSNAFYLVEFCLLQSGNDATGDYRGRFSTPTLLNGTSLGFKAHFSGAGANTFDMFFNGVSQTPSADMIMYGDAGDSVVSAYLKFTIRTTTSDGNLRWQFANSAAASGRISTTHAGSTLRIKRLDNSIGGMGLGAVIAGTGISVVTNSGPPVTYTLRLSDGDKGDVTVSGSGATWTVDNDAITFAKIQNITDARLLGRSAGSSGDAQEITVGNGVALSGGALSAGGNGVALTNLNAGSVFWNTNSDSVATIDLLKPYAAFATNNNVSYTGLANLDPGGTNFQSAARFITNNSGATKTVTMAATFQNMTPSEGNTLYLTNLGHLLVWHYPGFGTNFYWKSR